MYGIDVIGASDDGIIGVDYAQLFSGIFKAGGGIADAFVKNPTDGAQLTPANAELLRREAEERARVEEEIRKAEEKSRMSRNIAIVVGGVVVIGGGFMLFRRRG